MSHTATKSTETYATLEISDQAYAEIKSKLLAAGYAHQFNYALHHKNDGSESPEQVEWINMRGIAIKPGGKSTP